ncbi:MAG TPA: PEGA domain-containing protein [Candidatus Acidoferrales bacterium]|nr:PEGA domain-containing protein [Candidatus Acidoferrales bacterium]
MKRLASLLLLIVCLAIVAGLRAQEAEAPLSEADFVRMVQAKAPADQIIAAIRARGISFRLSQQLESDLRTLKISSAVIDLLKAPGNLEIRANAPGGEVAVDGQARGVLSAEGILLVKDLPSGAHVVRVRAEGLVPAQADAFLKPMETARVDLVLAPAVSMTPGPLGARINVQAGTVEDAALVDLEFEKDPAARAKKVEAIAQRFGDTSPVTLMAYGMLQDSYLNAGKYDEALAAGQKVLERDPLNFSAIVRQSRAAAGQGGFEAAYDQAERAQRLVTELQTAAAPADLSPQAWEREKAKLTETSQAELQGLSYDLLVATSTVQDPAQRGKLAERFLELFPQSPYRNSAYFTLAVAAQQQGNLPNMIKWANAGLEADPNQAVLLMMMATTLAERGSSGSGPTQADLAKARELATRLLDLLSKEPDKARLPGSSDEDWAAQKQIWEGMGHLSLAQVLLHEGSTDPPNKAKLEGAIAEFKTAGPLVKSDVYSYARNQFLLGFAYAKLGDAASARAALNEVVALDTPYRQSAQDLLSKLGPRR